ncbi:hypothetical protein MMC30_005680 [Trapelia coarctata]|nr:hypothetical protein [Trapelia coarctata]
MVGCYGWWDNLKGTAYARERRLLPPSPVGHYLEVTDPPLPLPDDEDELGEEIVVEDVVLKVATVENVDDPRLVIVDVLELDETELAEELLELDEELAEPDGKMLKLELTDGQSEDFHDESVQEPRANDPLAHPLPLSHSQILSARHPQPVPQQGEGTPGLQGRSEDANDPSG